MYFHSNERERGFCVLHKGLHPNYVTRERRHHRLMIRIKLNYFLNKVMMFSEYVTIFNAEIIKEQWANFLLIVAS